MKSTKALDTGDGLIVQVTTQQRNLDGSYAVAEALTFVPGASLFADKDGNVMVRNRVRARGDLDRGILVELDR